MVSRVAVALAIGIPAKNAELAVDLTRVRGLMKETWTHFYILDHDWTNGIMITTRYLFLDLFCEGYYCATGWLCSSRSYGCKVARRFPIVIHGRNESVLCFNKRSLL